MNNLMQYSSVVIRQRKEFMELVGFETRNKYEVLDANGNLIFFCAEMQKGILGFIMRQFLGHFRSFELHFFNANWQLVWRAVHPFRFIFQQLDIVTNSGEVVGNVVQRWGVFRKRFTLTDFYGGQPMQIDSGFFSFWTFPISKDGVELGKIQKKWSGALKEIFTDADNFLVEFSPNLNERERQLVLSAAILVDLNYFERKAGK